jgi:NTE family protein
VYAGRVSGQTGDRVKAALVLGGGGLIGGAWEIGMLRGMSESLDPCGFDIYLGTSAGAIVGSQLASGRLPVWTEPPQGRGAIARTSVDMQMLQEIFTRWSGMTLSTPTEIMPIGRIARGVARDQEAAWVAQIAATIQVTEWPEKPLLISVVDTESGERRALTRKDGVPLARAVAASSTVPGMFPPVEWGGSFYMDGQVHSSTHADLLLPFAPQRVAIIAATNRFNAQGIGGHAERMLDAEIAQLRNHGCKVALKTPGAEDVAQIGGYGLMDGSRMGAAQEVGLAMGRAWGRELERGAFQ